MGWKSLFGGFANLSGTHGWATPRPIPDAKLKSMPDYEAPLTLEDIEERIAQSNRPKRITQHIEQVRERISGAKSMSQLLLPSPNHDRHGEERIIALLEGILDGHTSPAKVGMVRMARLFEQYGRFDLVARTNECIEMLVYRLIAHNELSATMRTSERSRSEVEGDLALASQLYREHLLPAYKALLVAGN